VTSSRKTNAAFSGSWHIVETELWDQDALDLVQPAFIKFDDECIGSFGMIAIGAGIDCRFSTRDGKPLVEFTFEGDDDGHPCTGRGWGVIDAGGKLRGRLFLHLGDDSEFVAERSGGGERTAPGNARPRKQPRRRRS
jgi:hypothetical protein